MSFEHPGDYTPYERLWHRLARPEKLARRATRVICPSGPVREAALARWGLAPERVRVVRSGAGKPAGAAALRESAAPEATGGVAAEPGAAGGGAAAGEPGAAP